MSSNQEPDVQSPDTKKSRRVTADLPPSEFQLMEDMRVLEAASTTDFTRALVRLYHGDPAVARLVSAEISKLRREKLEARKQDGRSRVWRRGRGSTPHTLAEGVAVA